MKLSLFALLALLPVAQTFTLLERDTPTSNTTAPVAVSSAPAPTSAAPVTSAPPATTPLASDVIVTKTLVVNGSTIISVTTQAAAASTFDAVSIPTQTIIIASACAAGGLLLLILVIVLLVRRSRKAKDITYRPSAYASTKPLVKDVVVPPVAVVEPLPTLSHAQFAQQPYSNYAGTEYTHPYGNNNGNNNGNHGNGNEDVHFQEEGTYYYSQPAEEYNPPQGHQAEYGYDNTYNHPYYSHDPSH